MKQDSIKNCEVNRPQQRENAPRTAVTAPANGAAHHGWRRFARQALSFVMILMMLLNSVSYAASDAFKATAMRAEAAVGAENVDIHVGEGEAELDDDSGPEGDLLPENTYTYSFAAEKEVLLSQIFALYQLPMMMQDIQTVMVAGSAL